MAIEAAPIAVDTPKQRTHIHKRFPNLRILIEGEPGAMEEWSQQIASKAAAYDDSIVYEAAFASLDGCTPSYLNGAGAIGKAVPPEMMAKAAGAAAWGEGVESYADILSKWDADSDLRGLKITPLATG